MWVIAGLLLWPLVEIALFVTLGARLGLWLSLAIVIGSAVLGIALLRRTGFRARTARQRLSLRDFAQDGFLGLAAVLLILPGFLTDGLGLLLLLPPVQGLIMLALQRRLQPMATAMHRAARQDTVIDGEWQVVEARDENAPPSRWTQH